MDKLEESFFNNNSLQYGTHFNELETKIGVLCDNSGSGKRVSMLSHISLNPYLRNQSNINFKNITFNNSNFYNNYLIRITNKIHTVKVINTNLIIVKNSFINY